MHYGDNRDIPVKVEEKKKYRPHIKSTVKCFVRYFPDRDIDVLDIGARDGYSTHLLKKYNYNVIGTEIIKEYADYAQAKGRNVIYDDAMNTQLHEATFDAIYSRHCIEHCKDSVQFLETCRYLLKPGGKVFITFPLENKKKFDKRKYPGINHMVYFPDINAFKKIVKYTFYQTEVLDKSINQGIIPNGDEVLFIGKP